MIGKSEWFSRRKYGGWGLTPRTWQGWVYIAVSAGLIFLLQLLVADAYKTTVMLVTAGIFSLDLIHIMMTLPKDELENKIEAMAERNAAWGMILVLAVGVAYQSAQTTITGSNSIDPFLLAAMVVGVVLKSATNLWLEKRGV